MSGTVLLSVLLLAAFVGFAVASRAPRPLHEPLLSWAAAVPGIVLVGAVIVTGRASSGVELAAGLFATVLATVNLVGGSVVVLRGLSSPGTARPGPRIGAAGAAIALLTVFLAGSGDLADVPAILLAVAVGTVIAVPGARLVRPTRTPQLVALFNGAGGGAAAVVALLVLADVAGGGRGDQAAVAVAVLLGSVSFAGSVVAFRKLPESMTTRPVILPGAVPLLLIGLAVAVGLGGAVAATANLAVGLLLLIAAMILGVMIVLPVGGTDVPIVGSLLNVLTGLAVAAVGFALPNMLLLIVGTLVGAAGVTLTRRMAAARHRAVVGVLFGALRGGSAAPPVVATTVVADRPVRSVGPEDVASLLGHARKVVVVPGYGLAVAQAQDTLRELVAALEAQGVEVRYGIHPVAGRMPGQLFALLAEAGVPREALTGPDQVNPEFATADVALVVGANDVVNPAVQSDPEAPIFGMPILEVCRAQQVVVLQRSTGPGLAGVENDLLHDPRTSLLLGDAQSSLTGVLHTLQPPP